MEIAMRADVLDKLANDKYFKNAIWALGSSEDHTDCGLADCMYGDFLAAIEEFFEHEYGITHDDILEVTCDVEREFDDFLENLPKCCEEFSPSHGKCSNCGTDMIDVPGLWHEWHCKECGNEQTPGCNCRYAEKYPCPYPERHLKRYGVPAPDHTV
jgi:hypothetical protein